MNIVHARGSDVVSNFEEMSLGDQAANNLDADVCHRCSVICQKPDVWSARWKFLFKLNLQPNLQPNDMAALRCEICCFFDKVVSEHRRLSAEGLPPPSVSIRTTSSPPGSCQLRISYRLPRRHQMYYVQLTHMAHHDERPSLRTYGQSISYEKIHQWIHQCENHDRYKLALGEEIRGLRVITCDTGVATVIDAPPSCPYVALSYVWGDSQEASTTGDVLGDDLPQTIKDSIMVTRKLGFQYLWVDRYCIRQHDSADKSHQISQMGAIYAHAELTLCAVIGSNPSYGLPGVGTGRRAPFTNATVGTIHLRHEWDGTEGVSRSVWASRGWTLQEGYLSRKRLFFTDRQVIFACNAEILYEHTTGGNLGRFNGMIGPGFDESDAEENVLQVLMETYSRRQLRYHKDAFNAIAGLLRSLTGSGVKRAHLWGVPVCTTSATQGEHQVHLLWKSITPGIRRDGFPSWSPLGWTSPVKFEDAWAMFNGVCKVQVWIGRCWTTGDELSLSQIDFLRTSPSQSRFLRISATMIFRFRLHWTDCKQLCSICVNDNPVTPEWDGMPPELGLTDTIICIAMKDWMAIGARSYSQVGRLLLLKPSVTVPRSYIVGETPSLPIYERVGSIEYSKIRGLLRPDWGEVETREKTFLLA